MTKKVQMMAAMSTLLSSSVFGAKPVLTHEEAVQRFKQVSQLHYQVNLDLTQAGLQPDEDSVPRFSGQVVVRFHAEQDVAQTSPVVFLDFAGKNNAEVTELSLNGEKLPVHWDEAKTRIFLPTAKLKAGDLNEAKFSFYSTFTNEGKGFHRVVEGEDVYVYTNLEPFFANEVFPLFDQPDLKARFDFELKTPKGWTANANSLLESRTVEGSAEVWKFKTSPLMSSYLIGLSAGPFEVYESKEKGRFPIRFFAPKSLFKEIDFVAWLSITQKAMSFYEDKFGPYPYDKYDQVVTPGTASNAMESLAAITFNPQLFPKGKMTSAQKTRLANVVVHEMAHQWFGNWVTMKWWDDLWLNEAFASFMAYLVLDPFEKELGLLPSWSKFYTDEKVTAYKADSYSTTHPIATVVDNTLTGFSNFDRITYDKGAAVLKQLYFLLGPDLFFRSLRDYFEKFAEGNATQAEFFNVLSRRSGLPLDQWAEKWINQAGTNSISVTAYQKGHGKPALTIEQFVDPKSGVLREHKLILRCYWQKGEALHHSDKTVKLSGPTTKVELESERVPDFVLPNYADHGFVHVVLDSDKVKFLTRNIDKFGDLLTKQQVYYLLWQSFLGGKRDPLEYVNWLMGRVKVEKEQLILDDLLGSLRKAILVLPEANRPEVTNNAIGVLFKVFQNASEGAQDSIFNTLVGLVMPPSYFGVYVDWLEGSQKSLGTVELSQDRRWAILTALARSGYAGAFELLAKEKVRDGSPRGEHSAKVVQMAYPEKESKQKWFNELATPKTFNVSQTNSLAVEFHSPLSKEASSFVTDRLFDAILGLKQDLDRKTGNFIRQVYPLGYSEDFDHQALEFAKNPKNGLSPLLQRALIEMTEDSAEILTLRKQWFR